MNRISFGIKVALGVLTMAGMANAQDQAGASAVTAAASLTVTSTIDESQYKGNWQGQFLRVVNKRAVAATNAGMIAMAVLARGVSGNPFVKKDNFRGHPEKRAANPMQQLMVNYREAVQTYLKANPDRIPEGGVLELYSNTFEFSLQYEAMSKEDSPYVLQYSDAVSIQVPAAKGKSGFFRKATMPTYIAQFVCEQPAEKKPYAEWEAHDFEAVNQRVKDIVARCSSEFTAKLPEWFPVRS